MPTLCAEWQPRLVERADPGDDPSTCSRVKEHVRSGCGRAIDCTSTAGRHGLTQKCRLTPGRGRGGGGPYRR